MPPIPVLAYVESDPYASQAKYPVYAVPEYCGAKTGENVFGELYQTTALGAFDSDGLNAGSIDFVYPPPLPSTPGNDVGIFENPRPYPYLDWQTNSENPISVSTAANESYS